MRRLIVLAIALGLVVLMIAAAGRGAPPPQRQSPPRVSPTAKPPSPQPKSRSAVYYSIVPTAGDGNCYFRAAAYHTPGTSFAELRRQVAHNTAQPEVIVKDKRHNIARSGEWVDDKLWPDVHSVLACVTGKDVYIYNARDEFFSKYACDTNDDTAWLTGKHVTRPDTDGIYIYSDIKSHFSALARSSPI